MPVDENLLKRERKIMLVLAEGITNKEIGRRLGLTEGTVKVHLHRILPEAGYGRPNRARRAGAGRVTSKRIALLDVSECLSGDQSLRPCTQCSSICNAIARSSSDALAIARL